MPGNYNSGHFEFSGDRNGYRNNTALRHY